MFTQLLQSRQWHPLATSTPLAEEFMRLTEVSTWSPPLDPSTPYSGYLRHRSSLHNGPTHVSGASLGLFSSHWNRTTQVPVQFQPDLRCRTSGPRGPVPGAALPLQVCAPLGLGVAKGPHFPPNSVPLTSSPSVFSHGPWTTSKAH